MYSIENSCGLTSGMHLCYLNPGLPYREQREDRGEYQQEEIMDKCFQSCLSTKIKGRQALVSKFLKETLCFIGWKIL